MIQNVLFLITCQVEGREGTGRRERAAKGDGKGKTRDVYKTWTGVHGPGPWTTPWAWSMDQVNGPP